MESEGKIREKVKEQTHWIKVKEVDLSFKVFTSECTAAGYQTKSAPVAYVPDVDYFVFDYLERLEK